MALAVSLKRPLITITWVRALWNVYPITVVVVVVLAVVVVW